MGLFSKSKRTTINEDNRTVYDMSGSTFDNRVDNSDNSYTDRSRTDNSYTDFSRTDNSYTDTSSSFTDNSYLDTSTSYTDNSYLDTSTTNSGQYAGNSGTINITDGGAFVTVQNAVSDLTNMGNNAFQMGHLALETMGKTADTALAQSSINNEMMRDVATNALSEYGQMADAAFTEYGDIADSAFSEYGNVSSGAISAIENTAYSSMEGSKDMVRSMRELTAHALDQMTSQSANVVSASTQANREALAASTGLMQTISSDGNDLLVDGVVQIVKYIGGGLAVAVVGYAALKMVGGKS